MKTVSEIKKLYLDFFEKKQHKHVASSSLIPKGDPTLLFTTAGMVQFKPFFAGSVELPYTRAVTAQKCLRTTDLENVGKTERHCTFFEMLGNFSFGDYFKKEAIEYALEFSLDVLKIPLEKIWITIYLDDDEAESYWIQAGIPRERIVRLGKKDNFWGPAGDSGACGPCSELYMDRGEEHSTPKCGIESPCQPGCDCDRFMEYWNLVFNQFHQDTSGVLHPLAQTGIDTGSGLERVALLLQGVDSVYDTDQLKRIIERIEALVGISYRDNDKAPFRVLTDHCRSVSFAIADGIYPDRTGRGYVIRRLIRRASLYARKLNQFEPFLYKLVSEIVSIYQEEYPELSEQKEKIESILYSEEKLFLNTLEVGITHMEDMIEDCRSKNLTLFPGKYIFKLYGTYGFPAEMTREILEEKNLVFDEKGFLEEFEKDRELSRESWKNKKSSLLNDPSISNLSETKFIGYESHSGEAEIQIVLKDGISIPSLNPGESGILILDSTPFYGESGGQLGDTGYVKSDDFLFQVTDTQKENNIVLHIGTVLKGAIVPGSKVKAEIDSERRRLLTLHHSGTHLMHGALREILGSHVSQKASLVSNEYLRFDFSHASAMTEEEMEKVEKKVNLAIRSSEKVSTRELPMEEARKTGAIAFFEDKYGDRVRVVQMGEFSTEFCGGCHVEETSSIGYFMITKESSPGAGNRRIEAVCGERVIEYFQKEFQGLDVLISEFNIKSRELIGDTSLFITSKVPTPEEVRSVFQKEGSDSVSSLRSLKKNLESNLSLSQKRLMDFKKEFATRQSISLQERMGEIYDSGQPISDYYFISSDFSGMKNEALKELGDTLKNKNQSSVVLFLNKMEKSNSVILMAGKEAVNKGLNCNLLYREISGLLNGKGGGKPDLAQGSASNLEKWNDAVLLLKNKLSGV